LASKHKTHPVIGWRERVGLPQWGIESIKAKVDTGALSSSLHAFDLEAFTRDGADWVRFEIHPNQRSAANSVHAEAPVLEYRSVRSSSGVASRRPVIVTPLELMGQLWSVQLTLANRDQMGFRMLLGRRTIRRRFLVDAGRSYLAAPSPKNPKS
jgi:hypothetical protein